MRDPRFSPKQLCKVPGSKLISRSEDSVGINENFSRLLPLLWKALDLSIFPM